MNVSFDFAHNDYIQIMINYGILGLIAYLTALLVLPKGDFRLRSSIQKS